MKSPSNFINTLFFFSNSRNKQKWSDLYSRELIESLDSDLDNTRILLKYLLDFLSQAESSWSNFKELNEKTPDASVETLIGDVVVKLKNAADLAKEISGMANDDKSLIEELEGKVRDKLLPLDSQTRGGSLEFPSEEEVKAIQLFADKKHKEKFAQILFLYKLQSLDSDCTDLQNLINEGLVTLEEAVQNETQEIKSHSEKVKDYYINCSGKHMDELSAWTDLGNKAYEEASSLIK